MHYPIREHLEEYLRSDRARDLPAEFHAHLESCADCRAKARRMKEQAELLRVLCPAESTEPGAGFYARVMDRVEVQSSSSLWSAFLEPIFVKQIVVTCMVVLVLLTGYIVGTESNALPAPSSPEYMMAVGPNNADLAGVSPEKDRQAVLLTLATYHE